MEFHYPIPEHRKEVYSFYKLAFSSDGCPMKMLPNGKHVFHPILPAYLICDFVLEFEKSKDGIYLHYAESILNHALNYAELIGSSIVFMYRPESGLSQHPSPFYSALTQAWYIKAICDLSKHLGSSYREQLTSLLQSLQTPIEDGGVLVKKSFGWILEEYPTAPPLYTLNGWLTVLRMIIASRGVLASMSIDCAELLNKNLDALEYLLPLYDSEFCLNSRYQLTGFTRLRLVLDKSANPKISDFYIDVSGEGRFCGNLVRQTKYRWENFVERKNERLVQFNIVLSLIGYPDANKFSCDLNVDEACNARLLIAQGDYSPYVSAMPTERWEELMVMNLPKGNSQISIEIPFDQYNLFAYPTNFKKRIGTKLFNAYHFIHIIGLSEIYAFSRRQVFKEFSMKWLAYSEGWSSVENLSRDDLSLVPYKYGAGIRDVVEAKVREKSLDGGVFPAADLNSNASKCAL